MRPPPGFEAEKYPLRHHMIHSFGLNMNSDNFNTALIPIVMYSTDIDQIASLIKVNPHSDQYDEETGPLCQKMSIIDRMRISIKFAMTHHCQPAHHAAGQSTAETFQGEDIPILKFLWRPIWNTYAEKLDAADDDTGTTVATILGLTKDATNEDIVPVTTNKLLVAGPAELNLPMSNQNAVQVFGDYNMTTNIAMEDHVFDEDLLQDALRRYTNKGALRSCLGRTRHVTLTRNRPYANFFIDKFVPRAIRRLQPYGWFGIQVHMPIKTAVDQAYQSSDNLTSTINHLGVKMITNYHEWNIEHNQTPEDA